MWRACALARRQLGALAAACQEAPCTAYRSEAARALQGSAAEARRGTSPIIRPLDVSAPASIEELIPALEEQRTAGPDSVRTGLVGVKVGMVSEWDEYGVLTPLSVLWFDDAQVVQVKAPPFDCTTALQIGCGSKKRKRLRHQQANAFLKRDLPFKAKLVEFKVTPDALLPVGTRLGAGHFVAGQHVDITANTTGKGFQGGMKRHGFSGQGRTHGHSLSHRSVGSIGIQGYARVLPGKRMPGRMGGARTTQLNCWVHRVDPQRNLLFVAGSLPGPQGCWVYVRDAKRKRASELQIVPFPTYVGEAGEPTQAKPKKNKYDEYKA